MYFEKGRSLGLVAALGVATAWACSSSKTDTGTSPAFVLGTGGTGAPGTGTTDEIPPGYCNGLLDGLKCGQTRLQADVRQVNMMLVIDQSGSMNFTATGTSATAGAASKWSDMQKALQGALKEVATNIDFGLLLYPYSGNIAAPSVDPAATAQVTCNVPNLTADPNAAVAVGITPGRGLAALNDIQTVLAAAVPAGGTPTKAALAQAYRYFTEGAGKNLNGTKWVLLATDGGPNCNLGLACEKDTCTSNIDCTCTGSCNAATNCCAPSTEYGNMCLDADATVEQIAMLAAAQIKTFVVGVPGTEKYVATLNRMATAGGVVNPLPTAGETYYAVSATNSLQSLQSTFSTITTQLIKTCDIPLKVSPQDPSAVVVAIDCNKVPLVDVTKDPTASGFYIDYARGATEPTHLVLTGTYCQQISTSGANHLDVISGCVNPN